MKTCAEKMTNQIFKFMHNISIPFRIHIPVRLFWCREISSAVENSCLDHFFRQRWTQVVSTSFGVRLREVTKSSLFAESITSACSFFSKLYVHKSNKRWPEDTKSQEDENTQVQSKTIAIIAQIGDFFVICWFVQKRNILVVAAVHTHIIQLVQQKGKLIFW